MKAWGSASIPPRIYNLTLDQDKWPASLSYRFSSGKDLPVTTDPWAV